MKIHLEVDMDLEAAKKFVNLLEAIKSDFELEDNDEIEIVDGLIDAMKKQLSK